MNAQTTHLLVYKHEAFTAECIAPRQECYHPESKEDHLTKELVRRGIIEACAPKISSNRERYEEFGQVLPIEAFVNPISLPNNVTLLKTHDFTEGFIAEKRFPFAGSFAGCLVIAFTAPGVYGVVHGSRDALIDRARVSMGSPGREHASVVNSIAAALRARGINPDSVELYALFSTPVESFEHPFKPADAKYAQYNSRLPSYVRDQYGDGIVTVTQSAVHLDLGALCVAQARLAGFGKAVAAHPLPYGGWFADTRHPIEKMRTQRNVIIVS